MTEKEQFELAQLKEQIYIRDKGICQYCGNPVVFPGELAHRIPQTKANIKKFGKRVIHHSYNLALVCPGKPRCNDGVMIGQDLLEEHKLLARIAKALRKGIK